MYGKDTAAGQTANASCVLFPVSTEEVVSIVEFANKEHMALVPSGGRTGLSGGATALNGEIIVSFDKMDKILRFRESENTVDVQAGLIIDNLQAFAESKGLYYPVEYASTGSSQVGGNIATNAGGVHVIRYGMTREQVLGLTVVTGKGELLHLNKGLLKNNAGYDLRHLFIGSEGTLGIITEACLQLRRKPKAVSTFLLAVESPDKLATLFPWIQNRVDLLAFEVFSNVALNYARELEGFQFALTEEYPCYALLEFDKLQEDSADTKEAREEEIMTALLESGLILDGTLALDPDARKNLWKHREFIPVGLNQHQPWKNDLSVRIENIPRFIHELDAIQSEFSNIKIAWFGHFGDGNIHVNIPRPSNVDEKPFSESCQKVNQKLYLLIQKMQGSVSAEHGIGYLKKDYLSYSRSKEEIEYMSAIKRVFDPNNILNPGKTVG
ncbi:MAG: FAD-binding oxidoreductase [Bacteroidetes bacterium]|nr:FAD-binding oxidoreductase [Bacteroidota bacterium]